MGMGCGNEGINKVRKGSKVLVFVFFFFVIVVLLVW